MYKAPTNKEKKSKLQFASRENHFSPQIFNTL